MITLDEAKSYLHIDYTDEDAFIEECVRTGKQLIEKTLRTDLIDDTPLNRTCALYVTAYLFEHREDADMDKLTKNLRYMLSVERKPMF